MSSPWLTVSWLPETCAPTWSRFTYQKLDPWDSKPPIPQTPRPKPWSRNASVTDSGRRSASVSSASLTAPSAVGPGTLTRSPLPPVPWPKQFAPRIGPDVDGAGVLAQLGQRPAAGVDDSQVGACGGRQGAGGTRAAWMTSARRSRRAGVRVWAFEPPLPRGLIRLAGGQVSWLPGFAPRLPEGRCGVPSGWPPHAGRSRAARVTRSQWRDRAGLLTGLPLTTGRMSAAVYPRREVGA